MTTIWTPDFCPPGTAPCTLEIEPDWSAVRRFVRACPQHQSIRDAQGDAGAFATILQSSRVKEAARYAVKVDLGLDKEHPGLPYTVDANGNFSILSGAKGVALTKARTAAALATSTIEKPQGTSTVSVD